MTALASTTAVLAAAVTNNSTFTVPYPTGSTQASLLNSTGGKMIVNNDLSYDQGASGFLAAFGASNITITNKTGATLAAQTALILSFGRVAINGSYEGLTPQPSPNSLTDSTTGVVSTTDTMVDATATFSQAITNANNATLTAKINAIFTALRAAGFLVN